MMNAVVIDRHGDPELLRITQVPVPVPGPREVLVRVHASSVNPADIRARRPEAGARAIPRTFPLILGYDFSGFVARVGSEVTAFREGDEVFGSPSLLGQGAHAEYVVADARTLAKKPSGLPHAQAGVAPLVSLTAWNALHQRARVEPGQWVLIHGGAGGVGHVAIQLAKLHGCFVIATAGRPESISMCRALGADHVIDYSQDDFVARTLDITAGRGAHAALDVVGGATLDRTSACVAPLGHLVTIVPTAFGAARIAFMRSHTLHYEMMGARAAYGLEPERLGHALARIAEWLDQRKLRVHVHATYPVRDLASAHRALERGGFEGKLAIQVQGEFAPEAPP